MKYTTKILHTGNEIDKATGAMSIPVYQVLNISPGRY